MNAEVVLAAVDGSDRSERAADAAIAVAGAYDADLHLLFVLDEGLIGALQRGDVAATSIAEDHQQFMGMVRSSLRDAGHTGALETSTAAGFSVSSLRQTPGSVILDVAGEVDADFLVIPRETGGEDPPETIGRAGIHVLEYASQPVLSV
jgi:nucleotide-binding universal stress UspA family protein